MCVSRKVGRKIECFKVGLGGEIVALSDDAGVPAAVVDLGILDDDGEGVLVDDARRAVLLEGAVQPADLPCDRRR